MLYCLKLQILIQCNYLTSSVIEPSHKVKVCLLETCKLLNLTTHIKDLESVSFDNFAEVKGDFKELEGSHVYVNKNLISNNEF